MCKYCSKLKQLNDRDERTYQRIIQRWKNRDMKSRKIISSFVCLIEATEHWDLDIVQQLLVEAKNFVASEWIGR